MLFVSMSFSATRKKKKNIFKGLEFIINQLYEIEVWFTAKEYMKK